MGGSATFGGAVVFMFFFSLRYPLSPINDALLHDSLFDDLYQALTALNGFYFNLVICDVLRSRCRLYFSEIQIFSLHI